MYRRYEGEADVNDDKPPLIVKATDICRNCGDEFANHNYVPDSLTVYKCLTPHVEQGYGFFIGVDFSRTNGDEEMTAMVVLGLLREVYPLRDSTHE
jgi:hypothetical protein